MHPKTKKYDVFVSYRRDGGYETALPIVEKLRSAGYRVFFDIESLNSGRFNEQLFSVIKGCKDFVLVLPENGLDRCVDENDWVRREVMCAIENHKNIVPVMLNGFKWNNNLPEPLRDLPNYQGVSASNRETFDLSVERLKSYLKSRPHIRWKKWLTYVCVAIVAIVVLAVVSYFAFRQLAKPVCQSVGTQMTYAMNLVHGMCEVNENYYRAWDAYVEQRQKSSRETQVRLDSGFIANINEYYVPAIKDIANKYPNFAQLSGYDRFLLGFYDVDPTDVDGLSFMVDELGIECIKNYEIGKIAIEQGEFNVASLKTMREGFEAERFGMNMVYYRYLEFMSQLPDKAWESHKVSTGNWHYFPTVSENMTAKEYAQLADKDKKKMEHVLASMQSFVEMLSNHENKLEEYLSDREKELTELEQQIPNRNNQLAGALESSLEDNAEVQHVEKLREEISERKNELAEANQQLVDQFGSFKKKFAIDGSEDQYQKWGKVCKAATHLNMTVAFNKQRAEKGMKPAISNEQSLQYLVEQLNAYQRYHPATKSYVESAKVFYADVAKGKRALSGMVVMGTQNDEPHPLLRIGDIVVKRNGKTVDSVKAYVAASKLSSYGTIHFLRLENGALREITAEYPETTVNLGLMYLKD